MVIMNVTGGSEKPPIMNEAVNTKRNIQREGFLSELICETINPKSRDIKTNGAKCVAMLDRQKNI
jgi:hypothetical protein